MNRYDALKLMLAGSSVEVIDGSQAGCFDRIVFRWNFQSDMLEWFRNEYSYDSAPKTIEDIFDSKRFTDEYYAFIAGWNKNRHEKLLRLLKEALAYMGDPDYWENGADPKYQKFEKEVEQILKEEAK